VAASAAAAGGTPALVLAGDADPLVAPEAAARLARLCGGRLRLLAVAGHSLAAEAPGAFQQAVLNFLEKKRQRA
jgi:pimeloyl-ACP methyl ester carboxylesterase